MAPAAAAISILAAKSRAPMFMPSVARPTSPAAPAAAAAGISALVTGASAEGLLFSRGGEIDSEEDEIEAAGALGVSPAVPTAVEADEISSPLPPPLPPPLAGTIRFTTPNLTFGVESLDRGNAASEAVSASAAAATGSISVTEAGSVRLLFSRGGEVGSEDEVAATGSTGALGASTSVTAASTFGGVCETSALSAGSFVSVSWRSTWASL
mmetsp:Transcript_13105/g.30993  ORF Transcript_13105/g.30993 Transcript_13105/m.30993 type:complete len:211 (+) Transcript_13105:303-935(+)